MPRLIQPVPAAAALLFLLTGCSLPRLAQTDATPDLGSETRTLTEARSDFTTHLLVQKKSPDPLPQPPVGFQLVHYPAPLGSFPALMTTPVTRGKHPAIVWIVGGFDNSIGDTPWAPATPDNDQSARAFPAAGVVTLYPSLRGGNNNPGFIEGMYGEVDDVIAAAKYLVTRPEVDTRRIYLGGHSTGGTLALLTAESTSMFRAVFAFGPADNVARYGKRSLPFDTSDRQEILLRAPILYMNAVTSPTFIFEGTEDPSNLGALRELCTHCRNGQLHFYELPGLSHFSELAPITSIIAVDITKDTGPVPNFSFISDNPKIVPSAQ